MMPDNIILIGMPGAGKSTAGVVLAKMMGYHFIDSDIVIQEKEARLLKEIIKEEGNEGLLEIENRVNASIVAHHSVIATGGSVIYGKQAMKHLGEMGCIVYLKTSFETIEDRISNLEGRGVAIKSNQTLYDLYVERCKLYEKYADLVVEIDNMGIEMSVSKILHSIIEEYV